MYHAVLIIFLLVAISLVVLILLQQSKSASTSIGTYFSSVPAGVAFSSSGSSNFMARIIVVLAVLFFILSLIMCNMSISHYNQEGSKWDNLSQPEPVDKTPSGILSDS